MKVIDVTVKSSVGDARYAAPTWDMVMGYKNNKITKEEYAVLYEDILAVNSKNILEFFKSFTEEIAIACYCRPGMFCHRVLLAKWLAAKLGWEYSGELR